MNPAIKNPAVYAAFHFKKNVPGYTVNLIELDTPAEEGLVALYLYRVLLDGKFIAEKKIALFSDDCGDFVDLALAFLYKAAGK